MSLPPRTQCLTRFSVSGTDKAGGEIAVSLVEDNAEIRQHLAFLLPKAEGIRLLSQHGSAEDALSRLPALRPAVVLMDINLPKLSGIECVRQLKALLPQTQVIMLTVHEDTESIFESLLAGATGYLLKRAPSAELIEAIRDVVRGGSPMTSSIARKVVQFIASDKTAKSSELAALTDRENDVLMLLAKGYMYKEIADQLAIHLDTVRNHIRAIYDKLHVHSRTEAVVKYLGR